MSLSGLRSLGVLGFKFGHVGMLNLKGKRKGGGHVEVKWSGDSFILSMGMGMGVGYENTLLMVG